MNNPTLITDTGLNQYGVGCTLITQLSLMIKKEIVIIPNDVMVIQVGLEIYNEITKQWEIIYTPLGTFYVDNVEEKGTIKSIKAYDQMYKLRKGYFPSAKHSTTYAIANDIARITGLNLKGISSNTNNVNISNEQLEGKTQIEMLSLIAGAIGGHVRISRDGSSIEFIEPINHGEVYTESDYATPTLDDATSYHITKLRINYSEKITNDEGSVIDEGYYEVGIGNDANTLELSNPLLKGQQAQATNVLNKIKQLNGYKRFDTTLRLGDYRLESMDVVTYTKGDVEYIVPILYMKMTLTYRGISIETQSPTVAETKSEFSFKGTLTQKVENIYADLIQVKQLTANKVTTDELEATVATIEKLYVKHGQFDSLVGNSITVQEINANIANINVLVAGKADISELNAAVANINILNADLGVIKNLVNGNLSSENIQTGGITSDKLTIANGFIKDAMIDSLNANKIKVGQINTALVQVASSSGNLIINDNTIQIRDANRVRVQIGKDASNDYSMSVWDPSGKLMFDARGLKADAIKEGIIRNDMISTNANIDGSKLNISSVVSEINEGSTTLKASKVQFDGIAQTLEVAFNLLKTQADGTKSQTESNTTAINVAQGKINTLIQDTTIIKDGQTVKLKDEYSKLEQTVGSLSSTIGKQQTTIDDHSGKITATNSEISSLKQNINGLSASVSSAQTTIQSHTQQLVQKADLETVNEKIDAIPFVGRNLFLNSDFSSQESWAGLPTISKDGTINYIRSSSTFITSQKVDVIKGEEYVVSALVRAVTTTPTNFSIKFNVGNYNSTNIDITSTDWVRVSVTITAKSTIKEQIYLCNRGNAGIDIAFVKLEKGTKDTDWSLAPEDIQASIDAKANSSDVYVKTEVYTKAQTDSAIDVTKNAITQSVASTYETKTESTTKYDTATAIAKAMNEGKVLYTDIAFRTGRNSVVMYNNTGNGNVVVERITKPTDCPTTSTHCIRITHKGTASPNLGGFHQNIQSRANAVFIQKFVAMLPSGYTLNTASNSMGDGYSDKWLTSNKGTGKWETYIRRVICGSTGTFSSGGYVHVSGATPTTSAPLVWYLASCTCIDITDTDERVADLTSRVSKAEQKITDSAIIQTVSQTINQAKTEAINSANSNIANQLKNYSTTTQMNSAINQKANEITASVNSSISTIDGKINSAQSQINQQATQIAHKVDVNNFSTLVQQNGHNIMFAINNSRNSMGIGIDMSGLYGYNNNIATFRLTEGKMHVYNSITGAHMGYFGTLGDDLRASLYGTNTFSVYSNDSALLFRARYERDASYGNATLDMCGGINFIHKPGVSVGINQILLGNDDRSDKYGYHNMSIRCWNSLGFQDNYGYTNIFADTRRGRWIMKGALYQNTQTPPATFSMNFDGEDEIYNSGYRRELAVESIMNLKTGVYVDNDGECCSAIYGGYSELITTEYQDEYGAVTTHLNHEALNASLVVTCQEQQKLIEALQKELNAIKEYLNVA